jgi:hypothetical protein
MIEGKSLVAELRSHAKLSQQRESAQSMHGQGACGRLESKQYSKLKPVHTVPPNPSIEGTSYGLRPPAAPHVTR